MKNHQIWQNEVHTPHSIRRLHSSLFSCGKSFLISPNPHLACFTHLTFLLDPLRPDQSKSFISFRRKGREAKWDEIRIWFSGSKSKGISTEIEQSCCIIGREIHRLRAWMTADNFRCWVPIVHTLPTSRYGPVKFIIIYPSLYLETNYVAEI